MPNTLTGVLERRNRASTKRRAAGRWATGGRLLMGSVFVAMATYNAVVVLPSAAELYDGIARELAWPGVDWLLEHLVVPAPTPWVLALVVFESAVGVLLLARGRLVRTGLWLATGFMVAMFSVVSWYAVANLPLVALALVLLRYEHASSLVDLLPRR